MRWLGLSPQGKYPVRAGDADDPEKFAEAWAGLESGIDRKAPLSEFYSEASIASLGEGVATFQRWGFAQGQGALVGALAEKQPVANAVVEVIHGRAPEAAAPGRPGERREAQGRAGVAGSPLAPVTPRFRRRTSTALGRGWGDVRVATLQIRVGLLTRAYREFPDPLFRTGKKCNGTRSGRAGAPTEPSPRCRPDVPLATRRLRRSPRGRSGPRWRSAARGSPDRGRPRRAGPSAVGSPDERGERGQRGGAATRRSRGRPRRARASRRGPPRRRRSRCRRCRRAATAMPPRTPRRSRGRPWRCPASRRRPARRRPGRR